MSTANTDPNSNGNGTTAVDDEIEYPGSRAIFANLAKNFVSSPSNHDTI